MLKGNEKIEAIAWAARKQGLTYGVFSTTLSEGRKKKIYREYEAYLEEKQRKEAERLQKNNPKNRKRK